MTENVRNFNKKTLYVDSENRIISTINGSTLPINNIPQTNDLVNEILVQNQSLSQIQWRSSSSFSVFGFGGSNADQAATRNTTSNSTWYLLPITPASFTFSSSNNGSTPPVQDFTISNPIPSGFVITAPHSILNAFLDANVTFYQSSSATTSDVLLGIVKNGTFDANGVLSGNTTEPTSIQMARFGSATDKRQLKIMWGGLLSANDNLAIVVQHATNATTVTTNYVTIGLYSKVQ